MHEADLYNDNCFITLTYSEDHIPEDGSLVVRDYQLFMKRLRKWVDIQCKPKIDALVKSGVPRKIARKKIIPKIKYFMGAEYGSDQVKLSQGIQACGRPHFHAVLFNFAFPDRQFLQRQPHGSDLYFSPLLDKLWGKGISSVGDLTFQSAAYVARYCMKKITGDMAIDYYQRLNEETGEVYFIRPEFMTCSNGIGKGFVENYHTDLDKGFVTYNGKKFPIPKYYLNKLESIDENRANELRASRKDFAINNQITSSDLVRREKATAYKLNRYKRKEL